MGNSVTLDILAVDSASNILKNIAGEFGALGAAAAAGIGLATGAFGSLLAAGSETQETMARFNSLVDSSPLAKMKGQMLELADATAKKTRFDNDSILTAEAQLAVYTGISEVTFPAALKATTNLAEYMGTDAPAAAKTLGRALEDIGNGSLSLLTKQKLLTKEQADTAKAMESNAGSSAAYKYELDNIPGAIQDQVKALQDAGKFGEAYNLVWKNLGSAQQKTASEIRNANGDANAQAYVLDILNKKMGNLAGDMANTFPGQITVMQNKFHDFWQEQGSKTEEVLTPLIAQFNRLGDFVMPLVASGLDVMDTALGKVVQKIGLLANGYSLEYVFGDMFKGNDVNWANVSVEWGKAATNIIDGFLNFPWGATLAAGIKGVDFLSEIGTSFMDGLDMATKNIKWKQVSDGIAATLGDGKDFNELGKKLGKLGESTAKAFTDGFTNFFTNFDFGKAFGSIILAFDQFVAGLMGTDMSQVSKNLDIVTLGIQGILNVAQLLPKMALNVAFDTASTAAKNLIKAVDDAKKNIQGMIEIKFGDFKKSWDDAVKAVDPFIKAIQNLIGFVQNLLSLLASIVLPVIPGTASTATGAGGGNSTGADFIVPPGYPHDSYPMRVESGEHVVVTPANRVGGAQSAASSAPVGGGSTLVNHGTIVIQLSGDKMSIAGFMAELGAAM